MKRNPTKEARQVFPIQTNGILLDFLIEIFIEIRFFSFTLET